MAGAPAWAPGPDGFGTVLVTQAGPDIIVVTVGVPEDPPAGFDWLTQATACLLYTSDAADERG